MSAATATIETLQLQDKNESEHFSKQEVFSEHAPTGLEVRQHVEAQFGVLLELVHRTAGESQYEAFERELIVEVFRLARLLICLFLCLWRERLGSSGGAMPPSSYKNKSLRRRLLGTYFGKVVYWRTYWHRALGSSGRFPLDEELGLLADGFSLGLLARCAELATKMSFSAAAVVLSSFLGYSPSTRTIEEATLGLGRFTQRWFEQQGPPQEDGEVLIIQIDSKAAPTATEQELKKRRGKRRQSPYPNSKRHRGRAKRARWSPRKRRKKGEKAKNGKMATLVVMYTLKRSVDSDGLPVLLGPINMWRYASFAQKRHAVSIARREADKRGFGAESGKTVQILTDGDEELERWIEKLFPEALYTLDVVHAIEYLYQAARCLFREGSEELEQWVELQKERLYSGRIEEIVLDGDEAMARIKSAEKRERLGKILNYLAKRADRMNYDELCQQDLEIGSGVVEGAVRYVFGQRFDEGGMRWIRERAEALLQLRCIELNGDWERFIAFVHEQILEEPGVTERLPRLRQKSPQPLPKYEIR